MKLMNDKREQFETVIEQKVVKLHKKMEAMEAHRSSTYQQIDKFFEDVIEKAKARCI